MPKHQSAKAPRLAHVFWPLRIQWPSCAVSRAARERMPARSLPASGSDQPWHQISSPARHRREVARLLRLGPVLEHGGGEQEDAVLAHPLRGPGAVVLLLEHEPLEDADVAPAVLDGPAHHRPAVLEHGALPGAVGLEAFGGIERGEGVGGDVRGQPRPRLGPEGLLLGAEGQVHDGGNLPQRSRRCQGAGRGGRRCTPSADRDRRLVLHDRAHEEVDHRRRRLAISEGTSPTVSNSCPPSVTVSSWRGTPATPRYQASSCDCSG